MSEKTSEFFENNKEPEYEEVYNHVDLPQLEEQTNNNDDRKQKKCATTAGLFLYCYFIC